MKISTVGFKIKAADLHRKSPRIFWASLIVSIAATGIMIQLRLPHKPHEETVPDIPPVIIHLENIPETRQRTRIPAPAKPFIYGALPIPVEDELLPDEITIEKTVLDMDAVPGAPPAVLIPDIGAHTEEEEVYEYFAVDEPPKRLKAIAPIYPPMAERAGIEGSVTMKILVNSKGHVDSVVVVDGPKVFHSASVKAAKKSTFSPERHNDKPVACWLIMPFRFKLDVD